MERDSPSMLGEFKALLEDTRLRGVETLESWLDDPAKFLKPSKYSLPIDDLLRSLTDSERAKLLPIAQFAANASLYYLLKYLEDGEAGYSFRLTMRHDDSGKETQLIGPDVNNWLADSIER
jgi:hypothetical protein